MSEPLLLTKLYIPPPRPKSVSHLHLIQKNNESLFCKLPLISAPAGFGKTTLVSKWITGCGKSVAWLSLDEGDNDLFRFLTYLISALKSIATNIGKNLLNVVNTPQHQSPSTKSLLTELLNEISTNPQNFVLVLDDYHVIDSKPVDEILTFLLEHLPSQMHLVFTTREGPHLPLTWFRVRGQLIELCATDLPFTSVEVTDFLDRLNGSLCDAITGFKEGYTRLEALQRGNFFIIPLDDKRTWYRYRRLFADALRIHLITEQSNQIPVLLHWRASEWYEHNGSMENVTRHALAADLVELVFPGINRSRQFTTLLGWLEAILDKLVRVRPVLSSEYTLVSMSCGELGGVQPRLLDTERELESTSTKRKSPESPQAGKVVVDKKGFRRVPGIIPHIRIAQVLARCDIPVTLKLPRRGGKRLESEKEIYIPGCASEDIERTDCNEAKIPAHRR